MLRVINTGKRLFSSSRLTHIDVNGKANMVDVSNKVSTLRTAVVQAVVYLPDGIDYMIKENQIQKGDVLSVARVAGIQAAKQTSYLIPLCHQINLNKVSIDFELKSKKLHITATSKSYDVTGVEIESFVAANVAAITIIDMCKAVSKKMVISNVRLVSKTGGKSGDYHE